VADAPKPSPRDVQDMIMTRLANEPQPAEPDADTSPTADAGAATRATEASSPDAATVVAADPDATRASTGQPSEVGSSSGALTGSTRRGTGTFTRLGRTRTNATLPRDTQDLDLKLQMSRGSVLADLGRLGPGSIPPGVQKLIDEHGTEGRYAVDKPLAQGGMGAVLLIKDGDFQRPAAMKVMLSRYAQNAEAMERFLAEAQVTAQLEHPNIVPIHDLGIMEDGTVYFTMKYIEGESLGSVVKKLKSEDAAVAAKAAAEWSDERILLTFLKVLDGMSYAHAKGVVHRDIKPDNIMLGGHGEVLVVDWGIAKVLGRDEFGKTQDVVHLRDQDALSLTREGSTMGTLYYMPPEQASGELAAIGPHSDVYALGATLYELLTRKRPVSGPTAVDIIAKVVRGEIVPILTARPDLPPDLAAIVTKSMALAPDRRYAQCSAFAEDVRRYLAGQAVAARRRNLIERVGAWVQSHRRQVLAGAAGVVLVVASAAAAVWWTRSAEATRVAGLLAQAESAASAGQWQQAYDAATQAGELPVAIAIKTKAEAAIDQAKREAVAAAAAEANRATALRLTAEARTAKGTQQWTLVRDKAKAALEAAPIGEAQDLLAEASAALADALRQEQRAKALTHKTAGDAALATAASMALLDPKLPEAIASARAAYALSAADGVAISGVDAALATLGELQARSDQENKNEAKRVAEAAEAARRRAQADEALAAAETALGAAQLDQAADQVAAARKLAPADERANALRERVLEALRQREVLRASEAARAQARRSAADSLASARSAEAAMRAAAQVHATRSAEATRLETALAAEPVERKQALFAARTAAQQARAQVAEQWALAEGAARGALDALAGEPQHADAAAARALLIDLYRGRLADARRSGALPEIAAFTNLLRRLGNDPGSTGEGRLVISGAGGTRIVVHRLVEDGLGRLVAEQAVGETTLPDGVLALPAGRYELRSGDELASVVIGDGAETTLAWAPASRPQIPGLRLRWVPHGRGFWLAEDEVTIRQYANFLADAAIASQVRASWLAYKQDDTKFLSLFPRQGGAPDEAVWQPVPGADGISLASWTPKRDTLGEPLRGVSRDDAVAYCQWLGRASGRSIRLPTLAEWRAAANGGDDRRIHPWGPGFDHTLATSAVPKKDHPPVVGSAASDRGPYGHRDLAGGVREWVSDGGLVYDARIAGGAWTDEDPARLRCDSVESTSASATFAAIGFRILVEP
jgi:formylglycine-generating enzyme required for sulfatase activity/tRNA A-37 threonylcarbamoyl transferase component Bud32